MVIYNMNDKSIKCLSKLLTNHERTIFNILLGFFNNDKKENIDKFIDFISTIKFYNDYLTILELEADEKFVEKKINIFKKSNETEKEKKALDNFNTSVLIAEKKEFEKIKYFTKEIKRDRIIKLYEKHIKNIEETLITDQETKERIELKRNFKELLYKIKHLNFKRQNELYNYKKYLLKKIELTINFEEFDKKEYEIYNNKYEWLKQLNSKIGKSSNNIEYNIRWPMLNKDSKYEKSKRVLFLEILIWHSKIKNIIDNIKKYNNDKNAKSKYIFDLQEFEEMKFASNLIISSEELIDDEFNLIYSTLNSHYIFKMIQNNLENYLFNCAKVINGILDNNFILNNKNIINKNDYYFIREKEKRIDNNLVIQLPQLKPKDIVFLFIQFGAKNKKTKDYEPTEGPLLKQIKYNNMIDVLLSQKNIILNDDMGERTAEATAISIIYIYLKIYSNYQII